MSTPLSVDAPPTGAPPPRPVPHRPPRWWGALAGFLAAVAGLAVGELLAGVSRAYRSPIVAVGDRVVDRVPRWLKTWAIEQFGTNDKPVLVGSVMAAVLLAAMVVGVVTVRGRPWAAVVGAAVLGVAGAWAGSAGRGTSAAGAIPGLAAAVVAGAVLLGFHHLSSPRREPVPAGTDGSAGTAASAAASTTADSTPAHPARTAAGVPAASSRRAFLVAAGATAAGTLVVGGLGRRLQHRFDTALVRAGIRLPAPARSLPAPPADPALGLPGLSPLITPTRDFYRIDTALAVPSVPLGSWRLRIVGQVERELSFSYDDLLARDLTEADVTLCCVSNEVGDDLVGNARWLGVRLDELLAEAGVRPGADQVVGRSVDGFTAGFPVAALDGRDALVAVGMNGEPLPSAHGFPARLVVPGLYGYVSATKWLSEIELTTFDEVQGYWIPRGWAARAPIKIQSRIDRPRRDVAAGEVVVAGVAWAPVAGVAAVEVSVDGGPWRAAELGPALAGTSWRQWWWAWDAAPGRHELRCRATSTSGEVQTGEESRPAPDGATGWHTVRLTVDGSDA